MPNLVEHHEVYKYVSSCIFSISLGHLPLIDSIDDATVGFVTSGCPSPNLHKNIAMAYVDRSHANIGREMFVDFGGKRIKVKVTKMPFVPTRYYIAK